VLPLEVADVVPEIEDIIHEVHNVKETGFTTFEKCLERESNQEGIKEIIVGRSCKRFEVFLEHRRQIVILLQAWLQVGEALKILIILLGLLVQCC
jgi:hypothetical protein